MTANNPAASVQEAETADSAVGRPDSGGNAGSGSICPAGYRRTALPSDVRTMPVLLSEARGADQFFWQDMAAQSTILMVPVLLLALYLQRYLVKGLTTGAIK